ncbi:MAG: hypothetical protein CSB19_01120 [Clostridiales bacterium]|nr:MAG: hypothetical protein CSB19_01120 [Clostridiales bacterium]
MRMKNNLFDQLEPVKDGKLYAVNIHLKSGQVVHLEHLQKGEKDAYINYTRSGREKMLIETNKMVWRILPDDIERVEVKSYNTQQANGVYPFMKYAMTRSRLDTSVFTRFILYFFLALIGSVGFQIVKALVIEDPMSVLVDYRLLVPYINDASDLFVQISWLLVVVMLGINVIDLLLKSTEKFYILDENRSFLEGTKIFHLIITLACLLGFKLVNAAFFGIVGKLLS